MKTKRHMIFSRGPLENIKLHYGWATTGVHRSTHGGRGKRVPASPQGNNV